MKLLNKTLVTTLGAICILGTSTVLATDADLRKIEFELNNRVQVESVEKRIENWQTALASKVSQYDLRKYVSIDVYNQGGSEDCWAFAIKTAFETTLQREREKNGKSYLTDSNISALHMAYSASNSFTDGPYEYGVNRKAIEDLGTKFMALGYLTNGTGPIEEKRMKFSDNQKDISVSDITNKTSLWKTEGWTLLSLMKKTISGNTITYNQIDRELTENEVKEIRNNIKQHIMNYGAVAAMTRFHQNELAQYYNAETKAFYYNGTQPAIHAMTIIGWDDNYSKNNFNPQNRPLHDGAWLVQNSYGDKNTYIYVSYDDVYIESECAGITQIGLKNYENIYQHNPQGSNAVESYAEIDSYWMANVFTRDKNIKENLTEISVENWFGLNYELYVNPTDGDVTDLSKFKKVKTNLETKAGYTTIKLSEPVELTGEKFAIVAKCSAVKNTPLTFTSLSILANGMYDNLQFNEGECFLGKTFDTLNDLSSQKMKTCIKAFTRKIETKQNTSIVVPMSSRDQEQTNNCWTMPVAVAIESNKALKTGIYDEISVKHIDYATSQSFLNNAFNRFGYNRKANTAGTSEWALAYCTNGSGPIYEMSMPFSSDFPDINIREITNKTVITKVEDWIQFPTILKEITDDGIKYTDENEKEYTEDQVKAIRDKIKMHIIENGAITTETNIGLSDKYYNSSTKAYYCGDESVVVDHGVAIIGWDDNYSKENFREGNKPSIDGAYIVKNSWGKAAEVAEEYYISYEDMNIEKKLYGIVNTSEKDVTETIYQYDELGRNMEIALGTDDVYGANVFSRNQKDNEVLKEVSISTYTDMNYEVYINPNNGNLNSEELILVAKSDTPIENGYHTIKFDTPIELKGSKFAVAVKYMGTDESLVTMQAKTSGAYSNITSNMGESFIGSSLDDMKDLRDVEDAPEGNVCIKAFTQKEGATHTVLDMDVNLDGHITATDLSTLKMHLVGLKYLRGYAYIAADMNKDEELTPVDLSALTKRLVGLN